MEVLGPYLEGDRLQGEHQLVLAQVPVDVVEEAPDVCLWVLDPTEEALHQHVVEEPSPSHGGALGLRRQPEETTVE